MPPGMLGQLDLPTLVRNLVKNGVTGRRLGEAVNRFVPLLNAQGLQQYRGLMLNPNIAGTPAWARVQGADPNNPGSPAYARVQSAQDRKTNMAQHAEEFRQRLESITQRHTDDIQLKTQQLQSTTDRSTATRLAENVRAAIRARLAATQHEINAAQNIDEDSKATLQAQAKKDAEDAQSQLDDALKAQRDFKPSGEATSADAPAKKRPRQPTGPVKVKTAAERRQAPAKTEYTRRTGQIYTR